MAGKDRRRAPLTAQSEVEAYEFIRKQLRDLGWNVRDPNRANSPGQVWTQNQCLANPNLKAALDKCRPENIVKISESLVWVIEAKANQKELSKALSEATDFYSDLVNENADCHYEAVLATGVAGNEDSGYAVRTAIRLKNTWHTVSINGREATGLLSPVDVRNLLDSGTSDVHEFTPPQWLFANAAERINEILHKGGINKNDRA